MRSVTSNSSPVAFVEPLQGIGGSIPNQISILLANLYFSAVTFTTLGYGDIQPASPLAQVLASVESFLGALLIALLVFVLGRQTAW